MKIEFSIPTESDLQKFEGILNIPWLDRSVKITAKDDDGNTAESFMEQSKVDRFGKDYICKHLTMYYDNDLCEWFLRFSLNDYYNDLKRNPEKVIRVKFDGIEFGTGREIYKGIETGRYYLREVHYPREEFAKWYICGKRRDADDADEPRANLIFECNGQQEKVRYDDWNDVAAYKDTFNKAFSAAAQAEVGEKKQPIPEQIAPKPKHPGRAV